MTNDDTMPPAKADTSLFVAAPEGVATKGARGHPPPNPVAPTTRYLELLALGHTPTYATAYAGWSDQEREDGFKELARAHDPEFRQLEELFLNSALLSSRPAVARAFLAHKSLSAALRLDAIASDPAVAPRDRVRADIAILDHGPLAPAAATLVVDTTGPLLAALRSLATSDIGPTVIDAISPAERLAAALPPAAAAGPV